MLLGNVFFNFTSAKVALLIFFLTDSVISYFISTIALSNAIALLLQQRMVRMVVQVVIALAPADDCSTVAGRWIFALISSAAGCWGWFVLSTDSSKCGLLAAI